MSGDKKQKETTDVAAMKRAERLGIPKNVYMRYIQQGEFLDCNVVEDIEKDLIFICDRDTSTLYTYDKNEGIYTSGGEWAVKVWLSEHINPLIQKGKREEIVEKIKIRHYIDPQLINSERDLIVMNNGIYNIKSDTFTEHSPEVLSTVKIPVTYSPDATCDKIDKFISELVYEKDAKTIYEILGYCLYRDYPIRKAFIFFGETKNGKSALIDLIHRFLGGENTRSVPLHQLEKDPWSVKSLAGKLSNMCADISGESLENSSRFRELVGNDWITIRTMRSENSFMFKNYAKLIFSANKVPMPKDDLNSFYNRILTITFPNVFEGDKADSDIVKKVATEEELSGLFLKCIESLKMLLERRKFTGTLSDELNKDQYKRLCNPIQAFLDEYFERFEEGYMATDDFRILLNGYLSRNGLPLVNNKKIYASIQTIDRFNIQRDRPMVDGTRRRGLSGMRFKEGIDARVEILKKDDDTSSLEAFLTAPYDMEGDYIEDKKDVDDILEWDKVK